MKMEKSDKRRILNLLYDNLKNPNPEVVCIDDICRQLAMDHDKARQLLLHLDEKGMIQSDMDGCYSLITQAGIQWMNSQTMRPLAV